MYKYFCSLNEVKKGTCSNFVRYTNMYDESTGLLLAGLSKLRVLHNGPPIHFGQNIYSKKTFKICAVSQY